MGVSGNLCRFLKEARPLVLYAVEHGIAMEQMRGKWASSCVHLGYTELLCIPELTSVLILPCDSVLGDSLRCIKKIEAPYLSDLKLWIALPPMLGNEASSHGEGYMSWDFSSCTRNLEYILELQRGWPFETPLCSVKSELLSSYNGHLRNLN